MATQALRPGPRGSWRALFAGPAAYRRTPQGGVVGVLNPFSGRESAMRAGLVVAVRTTPAGCRIGVQLAERPNGRVAWVDGRAVSLVATPWRIVVSRANRTARLLRAGRTLRTFPVVVGAPATPTPSGRFAVLSVTAGDPDAFDGAWVLALTAESNVLRSFGGGPGRIGLHGRGGASLADPLGTARSHGCIRFANDDIRWIVARVGSPNLPGVPVEID